MRHSIHRGEKMVTVSSEMQKQFDDNLYNMLTEQLDMTILRTIRENIHRVTESITQHIGFYHTLSVIEQLDKEIR